MIKFNMTRILAILGIALTLFVSAANADELTLSTLMQMLAQNKDGKATFVEKKYIETLNRPVESSGELAFTSPDKLEKHTLKPKPESLILEGDKLTIEQPEKHRLTVNLLDHPEVSAFVESIRSTLAGDISKLEAFYQIELTGSIDKWQLVLTPKQTRMSKVISSIQIGGSQTDVKTINFYQYDGDHSEMFITKVDNP